MSFLYCSNTPIWYNIDMKIIKTILILIIILLIVSWFFPIIPHYIQVQCIQAPCPPMFDKYITLKTYLGL